MIETQEQTKQVVTMTINDLIYAQQKELGKRMDRIEMRMDKLEEKLDNTRRELNARMDKFESRLEKQNEKFEKLADKIDGLHKDIQTLSNHGQISNITTIGIALAVIYAVLK